MSSPDMDVDVGGTPEPDDMARDGESDLVVQQLEGGRLWMVEGNGRVGRSPVGARAGYQRAQGHCVRLSSPSSPGADINVPSVAIVIQLRSRPCRRKPMSLTCHSAYVTAFVPRYCVFDSLSVFQPPLSLKLIEVLKALHFPQLFLLMSGVEPCPFKCLRVQQSIRQGNCAVVRESA